MKDLDYLISSLRAIWCPKAYSSRKPSSTQVSWHHILDHNWRVNLKSRWTHSWNKCKKLQRKLPAKICLYDVRHNGPGWVWKKSLTFIELNMLYVNAIFFKFPIFCACHNLAKNRVFGFWKCLQKRNLNQGFSSYLATFCHFWGFFKVYSIPNTLGNHSHMPKMKEKPCVQILFWLIPCIRKSNFS